ncbi:hypothetical protein KC19_VG008900 [Ceratodon purpureus]|uniref:Uncharacterized protein n=1 Tax=Ceratodon purpureus TaxID=3225 RepID=A0A8T0HKV1_CERPU|nr:hypothetical protein KC19_VG008900 [Ceratodon purpureus]
MHVEPRSRRVVFGTGEPPMGAAGRVDATRNIGADVQSIRREASTHAEPVPQADLIQVLAQEERDNDAAHDDTQHIDVDDGNTDEVGEAVRDAQAPMEVPDLLDDNL